MASSGQFLRFAVVGTVGFLVDAAVLTLAVAGAGLGPYVARLVSFAAAATVTWYLNRRFTFAAHREGTGAMRQWTRFLAVNALGACINFGVYAALIHTVSLARQHLLLAVAAGSIAGLASNFTMSRAFVFRGTAAVPRQGAA